jgi:outer membrane immunogenic protein
MPHRGTASCASLATSHLLAERAVLKRIVLSAAFASGLSSFSFADGYGEPVYVPAFSWTGLYIGAHGGWERKALHGTDRIDFFNNNDTDHQVIDGWFGGAQLGYYYQFGRVVVGTELSGSIEDVKGSTGIVLPGSSPLTVFTGQVACFGKATLLFGTNGNSTSGFSDTCDVSERWTLQWLNKVGFTAGPEGRLLTYLTVGIAATNLHISRTQSEAVTISNPPTTISSSVLLQYSDDSIYIAGVLGAGMQYAMTNHVSLALEYLHAEYASEKVSTALTSTQTFFGVPGSFTSTGFRTFSEQFRTDSVRIVVNYKFGD